MPPPSQCTRHKARRREEKRREERRDTQNHRPLHFGLSSTEIRAEKWQIQPRACAAPAWAESLREPFQMEQHNVTVVGWGGRGEEEEEEEEEEDQI